VSKDYKVVSSGDIKPIKRKSPMHIILDSVDGDFWTMQQVADHIGVHIETIRRITKKRTADGSKLLKAPTSAVRSGEAVIYLFDAADVKEIEEHFEDRGYSLGRKIDQNKPLREQAVV